MNQDKVKFKIGAIQQLKALELGLDLKDAHVLTYIRDLSTVNTVKKSVEGKVFFWLDYEKIAQYLPLLDISNTKVMGRRMKKYEELGLIERHIHKTYNKTAGQFTGSYIFIFLTKKFEELFEEVKISTSDDEIEKMIEEMGLSTEDTVEYPRSLPKVLESALIEGTDECTSNEGTEQCLVNSLLYSINNTPTNKSGFLNEEEEEKIKEALSKAKKNIHVSRALNKGGKTSEDFIQTIISPAVKKYGFSLALNALKNLYNCSDREIYSLSGIYYSKISELSKNN